MWLAVCAAFMGLVAGAVTAEAIEAAALVETGELPVFSAAASDLGGPTVNWVKIGLAISLSAVYSCVLRNLKQDSRSMYSLFLRRRNLRASRSLGERVGFPLSEGISDG